MPNVRLIARQTRVGPAFVYIVHHKRTLAVAASAAANICDTKLEIVLRSRGISQRMCIASDDTPDLNRLSDVNNLW